MNNLLIGGLEPAYMGLYWVARAETESSVLLRIQRAIEALASLHADLGAWYPTGRSMRNSLEHKLVADASALKRQLKHTKPVIVGNAKIELGWRFSAWNGSLEASKAVGISVLCGSLSNHMPNNCVLDIPIDSGIRGAMTDDVTSSSLLCDLVRCFEPDWACINTQAYQRQLPKQAALSITAAPLVYLSSRWVEGLQFDSSHFFWDSQCGGLLVQPKVVSIKTIRLLHDFFVANKLTREL
jgi:hypothetical protein